MVWIPKFQLYDYLGTTLVYTFPAVNYTNLPQSVTDYVEHTSVRSKGSLIIDGGLKPFDAELRFTLMGEDYEEVTSLIDSLESTIVLLTPYILRLDKTGGSYFEYKVKRVEPFDYEENLRNSYQQVVARFRANVW